MYIHRYNVTENVIHAQNTYMYSVLRYAVFYLRVNNVYLYSFLLLISQQIFIEREILNTTTLWLSYTPPLILFMCIHKSSNNAHTLCDSATRRSR